MEEEKRSQTEELFFIKNVKGILLVYKIKKLTLSFLVQDAKHLLTRIFCCDKYVRSKSSNVCFITTIRRLIWKGELEVSYVSHIHTHAVFIFDTFWSAQQTTYESIVCFVGKELMSWQHREVRKHCAKCRTKHNYCMFQGFSQWKLQSLLTFSGFCEQLVIFAALISYKLESFLCFNLMCVSSLPPS